MSADPYLTRPYPADDEGADATGAADLPALPTVKLVHGRIGPYDLVGELGAGRNTSVFAARRQYESGVKRVVAVKTLNRAQAEQPGMVDRFLKEAQVAARISHASVCGVYDVGKTLEGMPYVVMEYLIGEPFSRLYPLLASRRDQFSVACCVRLVAGLCEGLHAIHDVQDENGRPLHALHRQIHPRNVFAMFDGTVRLLDLTGNATVDPRAAPSGGFSAYDYAYMAPEQLRGEPLDKSSDIWSLGVLLWEMLAGRPLFLKGSPVSTAVAVLEGDIPSASSFNRFVHRDVDDVLRRMLDRDQHSRYRDARDVGIDLENTLSRTFGSVSASKLAGWLSTLFPGCEEFRWRLVHHAGTGEKASPALVSPIVAVQREAVSAPQRQGPPDTTPVQQFHLSTDGGVGPSVPSPLRGRVVRNAPRPPRELKTGVLAPGSTAASLLNAPKPAPPSDEVTMVTSVGEDDADLSPAGGRAADRPLRDDGSIPPAARRAMADEAHVVNLLARGPLDPNDLFTSLSSASTQAPVITTGGHEQPSQPRREQTGGEPLDPERFSKPKLRPQAVTASSDSTPVLPTVPWRRNAALALVAAVALLGLWLVAMPSGEQTAQTPAGQATPTAARQAAPSAALQPAAQAPVAEPPMAPPVPPVEAPSEAPAEAAPVAAAPGAAPSEPEPAAPVAAAAKPATPRPPAAKPPVLRPAAPPAAKPAAPLPSTAPAMGQVYLSSKSGTLYVNYDGREVTTPIVMRFPSGPRTIEIRREPGGPTTSLSVEVPVGRVLGITLQ